jgi:hypothetical protein
VRPSSLNYKISLLEAVTAFMQKDKTADQVLDIEIEEPINKNRLNFDVLDDALYALNKASVVVAQQNITKAITVTKTVKNPAQLKAEQAQWEKEEETIRKKLERSSINMMKSKIAQQNRAAGDQSTAQP